MALDLVFGEPVWLEHHGQRLGLLPSAGGAVSAWRWQRDAGPVDLWRPWDGRTTRQQALASYPLVPWSNRIGDGGFEHAGRFHPLAPNTAHDPYPIHGDGWQQPWDLSVDGDARATMTLHSEHAGANPYVYAAQQTFELLDGGMTQTLSVRNTGGFGLPFGLGQHPWFVRTPRCRLQAGVQGVWLSRPDRMPTGYTEAFPDGWNLGEGVRPAAIVIDNGFGGWDGEARIEWPEFGLALHMRSALALPGGAAGQPDCLLYSPPSLEVFCFEPISHPINAAHLPGRPGWVVLEPGQSMVLTVHWRFSDIGPV